MTVWFYFFFSVLANEQNILLETGRMVLVTQASISYFVNYLYGEDLIP
jgi:hypothetical protein